MVASASALESAKASKTKQDHRSTANAIHLVLLSKKKERNSEGKKKQSFTSCHNYPFIRKEGVQ